MILKYSDFTMQEICLLINQNVMRNFNCELYAYICHHDRVKRLAEKYNMDFPDLLSIY